MIAGTGWEFQLSTNGCQRLDGPPKRSRHLQLGAYAVTQDLKHRTIAKKVKQYKMHQYDTGQGRDSDTKIFHEFAVTPLERFDELRDTLPLPLCK